MYRLVLLLFAVFTASDLCAVRIKDVVNIRGVRENMLIGYGLVVGLSGTGDGKSPYTNKSLAQMFRRMGVEVKDDEATSKNTAAVIVTAKLPPFPRIGNRIDVVVSSVGDASSLQGGTLLLTPLKANSQNVYAVAQGPLSIGGFSVKGAKASVQKNHVTVGYIPNGAIIEREIPVDFTTVSNFTLALHNPDFTTAARLVYVINADLGGKYARALDPGTVQVFPPYGWMDGSVAFLARIENLDVVPDMKAKVIVNERTGTVIMGSHVRISTVAIAHGALSIEIKSKEKKDDFGMVSMTQTVSAKESKKDKVIVVDGGTTINDVAKALNAIGATPRDLITVFQSIKAAGALQAELEII
jgi:flagellar P-ring protein precursor FlgI